ncbi:phosphate ABC transporter permease subunit PstC [Flavobacterium sp. AED]|jgi:phosphate transport system permease protein|uniref:phosphate ABC transporter permease subunit PstC n=1 Tax=Flavobacterium sp. AED TaxID=1423323 RepID=UPI00057DCCA5|nr:phosphate ABC transporter permease subunit PstC [Flavobacterium sp. AED]KIA87508.1 phosphate ABC transporter permease [Flavobacterium sp. AED]MDI1307014.1 phosphate ABC transporter permease subunit PstC [bacterium]
MKNIRLLKDRFLSKAFLTLTILSISTVVLMGLGLFYKSLPILHSSSLWNLLSSSEWKPFKEAFGFYPFIVGTFWVTGIAIIIALPLSMLTAIYLSEYANIRVRKLVLPLIELLSGIPPVLFGVWGVLVIVPLIQDKIAPHFIEFTTGYSVLAGGIVLAIMIFPLIISILIEVFDNVPQELRDASLALGATQWQTTKKVLLRKSIDGIVAAVVLAISRAFGETIAVLMVCGNLAQVPKSVFDSGYPLPALIANNYGEMMSIPMYDSALMFAALLLFVIIFLFNAISRIILFRIEKRTN